MPNRKEQTTIFGEHAPSLQEMVQRFYEFRGVLAQHRIKNTDYVGEYLCWKYLGGDWKGGPTKGIDISRSRLGDVQVKQRKLPDDGRQESRMHCNGVCPGTFDVLALVLF